MQTCRARKGFSLVELSLVIVVVGMLLVMALPLGKAQLNLKSYEGTAERIAIIQKALVVHAREHKGLPCPASKTEAPNAAGFGMASDCAAAAVAGTLEIGSHPSLVRIGAVPTRTLNLPDSMMFDAWGNRLTYAVTKAAAGAALESGVISVVDANGNEITTPPATATYAVLSSGADGKGTHNRGGAATAACGSASSDSENCDNDIVFRDTVINDGGTPAHFYDDVVRWSTTSLLKEESGQFPPPASGSAPAPSGGGSDEEVSIDWENFRGVFIGWVAGDTSGNNIAYDPENTRRDCSTVPGKEYLCNEILLPDDIDYIIIRRPSILGSGCMLSLHDGPELWRNTFFPLYTKAKVGANRRIVDLTRYGGCVTKIEFHKITEG